MKRETIKTVGQFEFVITSEVYANGEEVFGWEIIADGYLYQWKGGLKTRKGAERSMARTAKACAI